MLGADLGVSLAAQIFVAGSAQHWPYLLIVGYVCKLAFRNAIGVRAEIGNLIMGFAVLFLGLTFISTGALYARESEVIRQLVIASSSEFMLSVLLGIFITWIMYSSMASILLIASIASTGIVPADQLLPMVLGVNIGAALPALTATLGESQDARRVPYGNLLYRCLGVAVALPLLGHIGPMLTWLTFDPMLHVVHFHVLFNTALCIGFLGSVTTMSLGVKALVPDASSGTSGMSTRDLDSCISESTDVAISVAYREALRMGDMVEEMLDKSLYVLRNDDTVLLDEIEHADDHVDTAHQSIMAYINKLWSDEMSDREQQQCSTLLPSQLTLNTLATPLKRIL